MYNSQSLPISKDSPIDKGIDHTNNDTKILTNKLLPPMLEKTIKTMKEILIA